MKPRPIPLPTPQEAAEARTELEEQIRRRAYELYEQRGRVDGYALDDWLQAEAVFAYPTKTGKVSQSKGMMLGVTGQDLGDTAIVRYLGRIVIGQEINVLRK